MKRIATILLAGCLWTTVAASEEQVPEKRMLTLSMEQQAPNPWIMLVYLKPSPMWMQTQPLSVELRTRMSLFLPPRKIKMSREEMLRQFRKANENISGQKSDPAPKHRYPWELPENEKK